MKAIELAKAFGYMTEEEVKLLQACVLSIDSKEPVLVNIGAGAGTSALAMREVAPGAYLYSIDKSPGGPLGGLEGERNAFRNAGLMLPVQLLGDSADAAAYYAKHIVPSAPGKPRKLIDLLFVDDGHEEEDVKRDITSWTPYLKNDGLIAFHDYDAPRWPDVRLVVNEQAVIHNWQYHGRADSVIVFRVP